MAMTQNARAAAARAKMAKRAKRTRFIKENKKRILMIIGGFFFIVGLCVFTPWGPNMVMANIEQRKMETPGVVSTGVLADLYNLGVFYQYTFRKDDALKCYNEIGRLYFGSKITDYPTRREDFVEKRRQAEVKIKKGLSVGPPFKIDVSDLAYVPKAIWRVGEIIQKDRSKQHTYYIYKDLYLEEFEKEFGYILDPKITNLVDSWNRRFKGAK